MKTVVEHKLVSEKMNVTGYAGLGLCIRCRDVPHPRGLCITSGKCWFCEFDRGYLYA